LRRYFPSKQLKGAFLMAVKKKTAAKKTAKKKVAAKAAKSPTTKAETFSYIADKTGLTKKDVSAVFDSLNTLIKRDIKRSGPGVYTVPSLMKIKVVRKPATKARKGVNPFTGEPMTFKAKPARNVVKVLPLKALKDMV
jgi:nucleoid DNA-binding protein